MKIETCFLFHLTIATDKHLCVLSKDKHLCTEDSDKNLYISFDNGLIIIIDTKSITKRNVKKKKEKRKKKKKKTE